jgi:hypothetical protein
MRENEKLKAKNLLIVVFLLCALFSAFAVLEAQVIGTRVKFPKGRASTVLSGIANRFKGRVYVLGARAGQTMLMHLTSNKRDVVFAVVNQCGDTLITQVTDWSGVLPSNCDYTIAVNDFSGKNGTAKYTLEITIR